MAGTSHQTVRIARGRHRSPDDGACVMELASMLAGERFSDRPRCVDPVVASYLRSLNDRLGEADRQRLKPYAARSVGSRAGRRAARRRMYACLEAAGIPAPQRLLARASARVRLALLVGVVPAIFLREGAGAWAARELVARGDTDSALALIDRLLGLEPPALPVAVAGVAEVGSTARADLVTQAHRA